MEEKFLEELKKLFPQFSFKLIKEKAEGIPFGEKEVETLLVNKTRISISWAPALSEHPEEYFKHFWDSCLPAIKEITEEKKKTKSFKIMEKFKSKYVSN